MSFFADHLLTAIIFVPLLGAIIALAFPRGQDSGVRGFAMVVSLLDLLFAIVMWTRFDGKNGALQMVESLDWVKSFGIKYAVGVDGITMLLVVLTTFLAPIVILSTYSSVADKIREYLVCMLLLQTGMLGAFLATDLFLFYVFWELMLIPMYFLIGIWGGPRRVYAALKFFLFTMTGSLLMLVAILFTVWSVADKGGITFDWSELVRRLSASDLGGAEIYLFLAFAVAFAIKVPVFPFHTWLPDAHVEAPTGGSVILAGVLLKLGTFGFLRYAFFLFPKAAAIFLPAIGLLAVIGIVYGALVCMVQKDLKRLVAYSSVSHLGFVLLGLTAMTVTGVTGGVIQMINHGISTGALFLLVGVIYERRHTRLIADYGGLAKVMPWYTFVWVLITMSSIGVPGLNGFVGEFMVLVGAFDSVGIGITTTTGTVAWAGVAAVWVVTIAALVLFTIALARSTQEKVGPITKVLVTIGAVVLAYLFTGPPLFGYEGGLLIRPLWGSITSADAFGEVFATLAVIATSGVIFAAIYLLWATQRVFFGPISHPENEKLKDLSGREALVLAPLVIVAVLMGLFPKPFLDTMETTVRGYADSIRARAGLVALADGRAATDTRQQPPQRRRPIPLPAHMQPEGLRNLPANQLALPPGLPRMPPGVRLRPARPGQTPRQQGPAQLRQLIQREGLQRMPVEGKKEAQP